MIELRHLRYFSTLAEELHFTRAAARLNLAQPALSQNLRQLEESVGVSLVTRTRRSVRLTEAGRVFQAEAARLLDQVDAVMMATARAGRGEVGRLAVGFTGLALLSILPDDLRRFRARVPGVDVTVRELPPDRLVESLRAGDIDLVYSYATPVVPGVTSVPRQIERLLVAVPDGHPFARRKTINATALAGERVILPARSASHQVHEAIRAAMGAALPLEIQQVGVMSTAIGLVAAGLGVAIVPTSLAALARSGVTYRPLTPRATLTMSAAYRDDDTNPVLRKFLGSLLRRG